MANYFSLTLDTTAPAGVTLQIAGGAAYVSNQVVTLTIGTSDGSTSGYQMIIYGDVDTTYDAKVQTTQAASSAMTYATSYQVKLSAGTGSKTMNVVVIDAVGNATTPVSASVNLDTSIPTVTLGTPSATTISEVSGYNTTSFTFQVSETFTDYQVCVVSSSSSTQGTGTVIGTANGSTNMSATGGSFAANTNITCTIYGKDLTVASTGDGAKVIKVFAKNSAGTWSV